jgi:predicted phosphodiesterase
LKQEHIDLCKYYFRGRKLYDETFEQVLEFVINFPNATQIDYKKFWKTSFKKEYTDLSNRVLLDARTIANHLYYKIDIQDAEVSIRDLDDGHTSDLKWFEVKHKKMLILSDIHFPYHDKQALMVALRTGKQQEVDSILLNGDILDFYQLSKFTKDYRKPSVKAELDIFRFFIDQLKQRFPEAAIYYKLGNHEVRLDRWIKHNAQMFDGMLDLEHLVDFNSANVTYLKDNIGVKFGKLNIIHGHEVRANGSLVNIARTYYMKTNSNILLGHWHQVQEFATKTLSGDIHGAWATGCLCKLDADYTYGINSWNHGFAIVERVDEIGNFRVRNYKIINGELA